VYGVLQNTRGRNVRLHLGLCGNTDGKL